MNENKPRQPAPLGSVEPHEPMLNVPSDGQLLYKIVTIESLLLSNVKQGHYVATI